MDAYNNAMDNIGAAIINWSDPDGTWRADREVSDSMHAKQEREITIEIMDDTLTQFLFSLFLQYYIFRDGGCATSVVPSLWLSFTSPSFLLDRQ